MPFFKYPDEFKFKQLRSGISAHLIWDDRLMALITRLDANLTTPSHKHPHNQMVIILEGEMERYIGDEMRILKKWDGCTVPSNVEHHSHTLTPVILLEMFSPPREDYKT